MSSPLINVEHGFVIVRSNGRIVDGNFYAGRPDAAMVCAFLNGCTVAPARRITSFRRASGATVELRSEIVLDLVEKST